MDRTKMPIPLSHNEIDAIVEFIDSKLDDLGVDKNKPVGSDIFELIEDLNCIIFFYPLEDEENDAFLLSDMPLRNGKNVNVVFINTSHTEEKQVFAATHELGHLLNVPSAVKDIISNEKKEAVINRFAAEFLMPRELFCSFVEKKFSQYGVDGKISVVFLLQVVADAMDYFSTPYNSVIIRLMEVGLIGEDDCTVLLQGNDTISRETIDVLFKQIINNGRYGNLKLKTKRTSVKGLGELLDKAELMENCPITKIERLRNKFNISKQGQDNLINDYLITYEKVDDYETSGS